MAGQEAMDGRELIEGPVHVTATAIFATPKSWSARKRNARPIHWHTARPDGDNILKALADGLNGVVWKDDCQIALAKIVKQYGEKPGLEINVEVLA